MPKYSNLAGKVLEFLATGALLGFTRGKQQRLELLKEADYIWHTIDQKELQSLLRRFKIYKYVQVDNNRVLLTSKGKARWLSYKLKNLKLKQSKKWDGKWRMVLFDIPEAKKKIRDALRRKLKEIGFLEFQKSVFVYPYACRDEINFIINFFDISDLVYYIETPISPDDFLRKSFKLN
ncbi:hypothetical protein A2W48_00545 [Candidatus Giovannonibacteria bacterium RIFCSPHIGHO2_12_44_12]|uniref:Transcriptional repressor PaaX-like central Cas2-like domain-containing protein n=5 Tax=Candidatus Giovannoniibacteriota TaxID=1752738 RepID=A0A1F5WY64_9BACT|nr:MAG: Repressor in ring oxydation complex/ phenylacetic acid degradation pathway related protein (PaaX) [Candidatus Giovannonibacteria bacterium GW2011_GWC2_44_8]OGF73570.1 MAG: hypothetical protein A2W57_03750 [Candidatus Giovannonibacteria bacterium RIFCSPHIGHO2_02_43_16]OGF80584.1 MAG: hypothetical protein A2W48_00545 [Candidatus Giovannonibacteria bacterium RIFCSPHIGHO2_12_44_12]OGF85579.1 MAG: hypothetical protein A2Z63_00870 [Candidatus Giovannonibacteria bacterium RIFCSPLOWO2_02_44_8]O